jgi:hypothetical protein
MMTTEGEGQSLRAETSGLFCSTHHSLIVEPWEELPGGVRVAQADDPDQPMLLLRDRDELTMFCAQLLAAQARSEAR